MIESVDGYLALLKDELESSDPATIQDALSDAEEHLRTALVNELELHAGLSESEALRPIIEKYGTPEETAQAYRDIEARIRPALAQQTDNHKRSTIARFVSVISEPRAWGALVYMIYGDLEGDYTLLWFTSLMILAAVLSLVAVVYFTYVPPKGYRVSGEG